MSKNFKIAAAISIIILLIIAGRYYALKNEKPAPAFPKFDRRAAEITPSSEFLNAQKAVEYYEAEIRRKPEVAKNYIELAQVFLQEARVTGNHHQYIPEAQQLLEKALALEPKNFQATIVKASLMLTLHQFQEAKRLAQIAIAHAPYNAFSHGVLVDALIELGEYGEAVKICDKMLSLRPDLRSYARASYLRELHGDLDGAMAAMRMACDAGVAGQESRAWALHQLGMLYLQQGKADTAAFIFKGILEERSNYAYAIAGLAQVNSVKKNFAEAIRLFQQAYQIVPDHGFIEQLADLYRAAGDARRADSTAQEVLKTFGQHEQGGWNINREFAMFCANHNMNLAAALKRAKSEYEARPNNIDVLETCAWALYKNGHVQEAVPLIEQAMKLNTRRATLSYHAGMIYFAAHQREKAKTHLQRSLAENLSLHPLYVDEAQQALSKMMDNDYAMK
ncbi:MAG: tetratricopeptide repeat protein [candidate division KSB1 bacterium]|nr:tetratricopeptide repeat protein [candidate division KSB1 bacterium]MDZ7365408.1 tetratricopeptide repeat protein [candidate division KSB1 bacterium]MDZ7403545.1 tetratricopeptide repeat protein [candidate division KSB1 bacterium]